MKTVEQALLGLGAALALQMAMSAAHAQPAPPVSPAPVVDYEYDAEGRPTKATLAKGVSGFGFTASKAYDGLGRLKSATDAKAGKTEFGYDALDRTVSIKDPRSLVTQYPRNGLGDVRQLISPDTGTASHTYDPAGNLLTRTDSRGVLSTYTYDALNRLRSVVRSKSGSTSLTYSWTYDQTGAGFSNGIGRLTSTAHPAGSAQYAYDPHGRLITDTQVVTAAAGANAANVSTVVRYEYDGGGRLSGMVYPSGRKLVLAYDGAGQLSGLSLAANTTAAAVPLISQLQYEPFGGVRGWQWHMAAAGTQAHTRVFDGHGRLVRYPLGGYLRDITYDAANRITGYTHYQGATPATSLNQSFGYDELGRLTGITTASASWSIGYDANGNRTGVTMNGVASSYTTSATSNRLTAVSNPAVSFGYDAAGNTTAGQFTATYNLAGRMATLAKGGVTTTYSVDGQGRRVRKFNSTGAAGTIIFVYSKSGQLLGEYDSTGKPLREYVWLGSKPLAVFTPAGSPPNYGAEPAVYYIHADHIDTPRIVLDQNNGVRWRWLAEPFGTTAAETNPANLGAFTFNLRFPGQYFDQESGLHYNHYRDYDPSTGRYVESDSTGLEGGINTYSYALSQPVGYIDPNGKIAIPAAAVVIAGAVIAGAVGVKIAPDLIEAVRRLVADHYRLDRMEEAKAEAEQIRTNGQMYAEYMEAVYGPGWQLIASECPEGADSAGEGSGQKTVDDLIGESTKGRETKGRADQYIHGGGREQRDKDFDSLGATDVKDRGNGTKTGTLPDGRPVNVHDSKTDGVPTIQIGNGSREIKIRYP